MFDIKSYMECVFILMIPCLMILIYDTFLMHLFHKNMYKKSAILKLWITCIMLVFISAIFVY